MTYRVRKKAKRATMHAGRLRPLRTDAEHDAAVREIDAILEKDPAPGTPASDRLEVLSMLVDAYGRERYSLGDTTPQEMVLFMLEQQRKTRADLIPILGSKSRVSEFLNGKRRLSLTQIVALRQQFHIPADVLIDAAPEHTYPAPAIRAAAVRELSTEAAGYDVLQRTLTSVSRRQEVRFDRVDERLAELKLAVNAALRRPRRRK